MIYLKESDICFIKVSKTGSTAISNYIIKNLVNFEIDSFSRTMLFHNNKEIYKKVSCNMPDEHGNSPHMSLSYAILNNLGPTNTTKVFGVIRDPYERLLSMYNWYIFNNKYKGEIASKYNFTKRLLDKTIGSYKDYTKDQYSYFEGDTFKSENLYLYENIPRLITDITNLVKKNQSFALERVNNTPKIADLSYYSSETIDFMEQEYSRDFTLRKELRNN